jgi:predicted ATPase/transcriptional regulator with XRE-family HTH domain
MHAAANALRIRVHCVHPEGSLESSQPGTPPRDRPPGSRQEAALDADRLSDPPTFGDLLRQHRLAAGLSQEGLAERAGLSRRGISDLERGARTHPYRETITMLAAALGLDGRERAAFMQRARRPVSRTALRHSQETSLPVPLTPLIGRREERDWVGGLLRDDMVRLVTLTGPGGVGKTRLAITVAHQVTDAFPNGMVFVDLAPLRAPALVLPTVAAAFGLRETASRAPIDGIRAFLRGREMLLILDNFEHLLGAAPVVADILAAGPRVKVLATSRAPLRVRGEREYPVPPLDLPATEEARDLAALAATDAVAFFVDRAQAIRPDFALTADNAAAVVAICARLDGLPLALELAAARVKTLPPSALLNRLGARLSLLVGRSLDVPERQRTLRGALGWSHDLLSPPEQALFRRLGVFVGGWTLEAAEAVASLEDDLDVLAGLDALVDKSLVRPDEGGPGPRYRMLETIREFAQENLRQRPQEEEAMRQAHAAFFADLALEALAELSAGVPAAVRRMRAEEDNLRAMLAHLLEAGDAETALRVSGASLTLYWVLAGGRFAEARAWLDRGFQHGAAVSPAARAWGLNGFTLVNLFQGEFVTARTAATECRALAHATDDPLLAAEAALNFSFVEEAAGRAEEAARLATEAIATARAAADTVTLGWSLKSLGAALSHTGDLDGAKAALEEALTLFRGVGGAWGESSTLMSLAEVARAEGNLRRAARLHAESLRLRGDAGALAGIYNDLVGIAEIAQAMGYADLAARLLGAEDAQGAVFGSVGWGVTPLRRERTWQNLVEELGGERFAEAWDAGRALSTEQAIAEALALADDLSIPAED